MSDDLLNYLEQIAELNPHARLALSMAVTEIRRLNAELEVAREALEPFARMGQLIELETTGFDDGDELSLVVEDGHLLDRFKVGDFRRARAALGRISEGEK